MMRNVADYQRDTHARVSFRQLVSLVGLGGLLLVGCSIRTPLKTATISPVAVPTSGQVPAAAALPPTAAPVPTVTTAPSPTTVVLATSTPAATVAVATPTLLSGATASSAETAATLDLLSLIHLTPKGTFTLTLTDAQLAELARQDVADSFDPAVYNLKVTIKPDGLRLSARLVSLSRSMAVDATANGTLIVVNGQPRYDMTSSDVEIVCYLCRVFDDKGEPAVRVTPGAESVLTNEQMIADNRLRWKQFGQGMIQNALWRLSTDPRAKTGLLGREVRLERITLGDGELSVEGRLQ